MTPGPGGGQDPGFWQDLLENVHDLVQSLRPDGTFLYVNRAWREALRYDADDVAGLSLADVVDPACRPRAAELLRRGLEGECVDGAELVLVARGGRRLAVEWKGFRRCEEGRPTALQVILRQLPEHPRAERPAAGSSVAEGQTAERRVPRRRDLSETERALRALRESERRFRELTRNAPVGICLADGKGGCFFVNERWCQLAGLAASEAWGDGWQRALHAEDRARVVRDWRQAVAEGRELVVDCRFQAAGGRVTWLHATVTPMRGESGEVEGYLSMVLDLTDRRRAEEERRRHEAQLQHLQKLESLGVLAGGIAHDFNNLLTSVLGYSSLALMQLPAESSACPLLGEIEHAARRAAELTQQMLAYSGKGKFVVQKVDLDSLIEEMAPLLCSVVSKKAELRIELEPAAIEADVSQIRQVVMNLLTNASDALEGHAGVIHLRTGRRKVDAAYLRSPYASQELPAGDYAFIEVEDDGCGMSEETLERIFDPFFTTKFTGRGLGLAAVLGIVRGHQGTIKLTSTPCQGTCFQVFFPSASHPGTAPARGAAGLEPPAATVRPLLGHPAAPEVGWLG